MFFNETCCVRHYTVTIFLVIFFNGKIQRPLGSNAFRKVSSCFTLGNNVLVNTLGFPFVYGQGTSVYMFFFVQNQTLRVIIITTFIIMTRMCFFNEMTWLKKLCCGVFHVSISGFQRSRLILTHLSLGHQFSLCSRSSFHQSTRGSRDGLGGLEDLLLKVQALVSLLFTREENQQPTNTPLLGC